MSVETLVEVTSQNAEAYLIRESFNRPVLVDFWADWCAPCKTLKPMLERLAVEYQGAFLLATVNVDAEPMLAGQFGVQSLPTVVLMKNGQPLDGFMGAKSEQEVKQFLERHLPRPWDIHLAQARTRLAEGDAQGACSLLRGAYTDSKKRPDIACELARVLIQLKRLDEVQALLDAFKLADRDAEYEHLCQALALAQAEQKSPRLVALEQALQQQPDDVALAHSVALAYHEEGLNPEALELLFRLLSASLSALDGEVRKSYATILTALGKSDPLAALYQRKLYSLLY